MNCPQLAGKREGCLKGWPLCGTSSWSLTGLTRQGSSEVLTSLVACMACQSRAHVSLCCSPWLCSFLLTTCSLHACLSCLSLVFLLLYGCASTHRRCTLPCQLLSPFARVTNSPNPYCLSPPSVAQKKEVLARGNRPLSRLGLGHPSSPGTTDGGLLFSRRALTWRFWGALRTSPKPEVARDTAEKGRRRKQATGTNLGGLLWRRRKTKMPAGATAEAESTGKERQAARREFGALPLLLWTRGVIVLSGAAGRGTRGNPVAKRGPSDRPLSSWTGKLRSVAGGVIGSALRVAHPARRSP